MSFKRFAKKVLFAATKVHETSRRFSISNLILLLLVCTETVSSQGHYYITPSPSVPCPGDPCVALEEVAANSTSSLGNETNISLSFLPGNHSLYSELSVSNIDNFSMTKDTGGNGIVFVECGSLSGRFNISESTFATIKDLHFIGCGGNRVSKVEQFMIEDTTFEGVEGRGTALVLKEVANATIATSSFFSNKHGSTFESHGIPTYASIQAIMNYVYLNQNSSLVTGGALYTAFSNVSIVGSKFTDNTAEIGGALFAHSCSLHVVRSTYSYNKASFGGVMITSESSVNIENSTFSKNTAVLHGGVMITCRDSLSISGSIFTSSAVSNGRGGVILTSSSSFNITSSTFTSNSADIDGGVMDTSRSSFTITSSTFTNNSVAGNGDRRGGVMYTFDSLFNIASSTFTNNSAAIAGGVMYTFDSLFNIASSTFTNNSAAIVGGIMDTSHSSFTITSSTFTNNSARFGGGVMYIDIDSSFDITNSTFTKNSARIGGVVSTSNSSLSITSSTFTNNSADSFGCIMGAFGSSFNIARSTFTSNSADIDGGVLGIISCSSFTITSSTFTNNSAADDGGVMCILIDSSVNITGSTFTTNSAADVGGVMHTSESSLNITNSTFTKNNATRGGGAILTSDSSFIISSSTFTKNSARIGGVVITSNSSLNITSSTFTNNSADYFGCIMGTSGASFIIARSTFTSNCADIDGGVLGISRSSLTITGSTFTNNSAADEGGAMYTINDFSLNISNSTFTNNSAARGGGVIWASTSSMTLNISGSSFYANKANSYGGIMYTFGCSIHVSDGTFDRNTGSIYTFNSNLTFSGNTSFENCEEPSNKTAAFDAREEGGAITSFQSAVIFTGISSLSKNQAKRGGSILAIESEITIYGETTIANNSATESSGGGISIQQSDLAVKGNSIISGNKAMRGGGIHAASSTIEVHQPQALQIINNRAVNGSGLYLEVNAKLYVLNTKYAGGYLLMFKENHARYGGAIYVADVTNSGACSADNECFIQSLVLYQVPLLVPLFAHRSRVSNTLFSSNSASENGANIFGGLLDRCIQSPFTEVFHNFRTHDSGISYLDSFSKITALDTISSLPVRVCFCKSESEPDCSYQPPTINVKKGEAFTVPLVAVDQVNHSVVATIISSLSSQDGGFGEGQQTQSVGKYCSNLTFNVFSPHSSETVNLYADGPCGNSLLSTRHLHIQFTECTCPVGFEFFTTDTRCQCFCDALLSPHITNCDPMTESLVRMNTNSWITHVNDTQSPGYIIHPNCPLDYCRPPTENVSMNLNLPDGSDAQCAYNRSGVLCGACQEHLSLSLGSSRCLPCHGHWPAVLVIILLAAIIAGILLVTALLALNMTVAVGLINGFIFYANIVSANSAVFFPSSESSFPTVFVAWLNLDIGIDVCFFDGLDAYTKTWLQLAFPVYIISLVIIIIIVSEYSSRFAEVIGKRDPVATLATLILLSYAKLLSVTITALSFAVLDYPDGSQKTVWLPDGNVPYFQGKHVALVLAALLIILVGVPYTILLFLWQWLVRAPKWKVFKWTRNTKLNAFISVHHVPYNSKYRYWTGLLLLVRVILYVTASVTVSRDPQTSLLLTNVLVGSLSLIKEITGVRVYKKSFLNIVESMLYFNLLALSAFSWYRFKTDIEKQRAVSYTSTIITFILLVGVIAYHVYLLVRKDQPQGGEEVNEYPLAPVQPAAKDEITYSVVEIPKPRDPSPPTVAKSEATLV